MAESLPYVDAYGKIKDVFLGIKRAAVPPKFNQDFLSGKLGFTSSSYRAMIPLLKRLGFVDQANVPTRQYKDYRDDKKSKSIMANQVKEGYKSLFDSHEYANTLQKSDLVSTLKTVTGAGEDDAMVSKIAGSFLELCKLADFENAQEPSEEEEKVEEEEAQEKGRKDSRNESSTVKKLGISYTINLNLPATTEVGVFNAIFKSLKEHILND